MGALGGITGNGLRRSINNKNNSTQAVVRSSLSIPSSLSTMPSRAGHHNNRNNNNSSSNQNASFATVVEESTRDRSSLFGLLLPPPKQGADTTSSTGRTKYKVEYEDNDEQ